MNNIYDPPNAPLEDSSFNDKEEMKQIVSISNWDVVKMVFYSSLRNKSTWAISIFCVGIWHAVGFVGLWALDFPYGETTLHTLSMLLWIIIVFAISTIVGAATLLLNPKWRKGRIGEHKITVTDSHLIEETEFNKTYVSWESVEKLSKGKSSFYITHSGTEVFIVSSKCFRSKAAWEHFYKVLKGKYESEEYA